MIAGKSPNRIVSFIEFEHRWRTLALCRCVRRNENAGLLMIVSVYKIVRLIRGWSVRSVSMVLAAAIVIFPVNSLLPGHLVVPASAQERSQEQDRARLERRLKDNRKLLNETREQAGSIRDEMDRLRKERADLNKNLIRSGAEIKKIEQRMTAIEERLFVLEGRERVIRASLKRQHSSIARLLSAMQRMGRNPPPVIVTERNDALKMVRSAMLLAKAFPKLRGEAENLAAQLKELLAIKDRIRTDSAQLQAQASKLSKERAELAYLMQTRRQSLNVRQLELAEVERTVGDVRQNVKSLEQLIDRATKAIEEKTALGRKIKEALVAKPAPTITPQEPQLRGTRERNSTQLALNVPKPPSPTPDTGAATVPGKPDGQPGTSSGGGNDIKVAVKLAPSTGAFVADAARLKPAVPFWKAKGTLPLPAAGKIETLYGQRTKFGGRSKGVVIKTRYGAQITAPSDGWVVYAGKFRTYGQLLIIKAGGGYHVLLAGLSSIDVRAGQFVLSAEPVGTMKSAPGRRAGRHSPRLYVEFRKDGRPINPRPWWSANAKQKVQG